MVLLHIGIVVTRLNWITLEIAVTLKRNIGMACVIFTKIIHDAFGFMLYIHTAIILSLKPSIFSFYSSSLAK